VHVFEFDSTSEVSAVNLVSRHATRSLRHVITTEFSRSRSQATQLSGTMSDGDIVYAMVGVFVVGTSDGLMVIADVVEVGTSDGLDVCSGLVVSTGCSDGLMVCIAVVVDVGTSDGLDVCSDMVVSSTG